MLRVAILGSTGQLGRDLVEVLEKSGGFEIVPFSHEQADCTQVASLRSALLAARPQVVINCAAFVRVDDCEDQAQEAFEVNALGALTWRGHGPRSMRAVLHQHGLRSTARRRDLRGV